MNGESKPLGEITDFFWRIEFQKRGSPHVHGLLWVKDAPDVLASCESEAGQRKLAAFVDKHIASTVISLDELAKCTCARCRAKENNGRLEVIARRPPSTALSSKGSQCDLARVVHRVQQHVCVSNSRCRQKTGDCRFGFPKPLRDVTRIEVKKMDDGTPMTSVETRRNNEATNNYCPMLLRSWRANMDIKLVGNAYGAAEYTAAYSSKAEPDSERFRRAIAKAIAKCDDELPHHAVLKKIANATLSIREVSAQEAHYILSRDMPLYGKSRNVLYLKTTRHDRR